MNSNPASTAGQWPPEVPPLHPPVPPREPGPPSPPPTRPSRILPAWEEPDPGAYDRDLAERLLDHRVIVVGGALDSAAADRTAAALLLLGRRSHEPVELHLSCPDSELGAALSLADAVDLVQAPVHAFVRGVLKGPALAVLCAADRRVAHRNALLVMTVPRVSAEGTSQVLIAVAEQHQRQVAQLRAWLVKGARRDEDEVVADLETGRLLTAEEAVGYGLVQEVH